jgi:hypothetical protein
MKSVKRRGREVKRKRKRSEEEEERREMKSQISSVLFFTLH